MFSVTVYPQSSAQPPAAYSTMPNQIWGSLTHPDNQYRHVPHGQNYITRRLYTLYEPTKFSTKVRQLLQ